MFLLLLLKFFPKLFPLKPSIVMTYLDQWIPRMIIITSLLMIVGLWLALWYSPSDLVQGETVRIMYIHVPASWGALLTYFGMAIVSIYAFVKQHPLSHLITKAMAPVGTLLCTISLVTGSIWGKPTWGTWWVWDARLTSMLLLFFLYGGYLLTVHYIKPETQALKTAALIAIIGSCNLPIIKWSVTWWNTLHQPASIIRIGKPSIHFDMMVPLIMMTLAMIALSYFLFLLQLRFLMNQKRLKRSDFFYEEEAILK